MRRGGWPPAAGCAQGQRALLAAGGRAGRKRRQRESHAATRPLSRAPLHSTGAAACGDSIDHDHGPRPDTASPTPSTTAATDAAAGGDRGDGRSLAAGRRDRHRRAAHRRPARAELSRTAARSSSTRSRRCTSCGWRRASGGYPLQARRRALARHARRRASSSTCCRPAPASRPARPLQFEPLRPAAAPALSAGLARNRSRMLVALFLGRRASGALSSRPRLLTPAPCAYSS